MAVIETWFNQDLQKPVKVQYLDGSLFSNNGNGNRIGVNVYDNGEAVTLTGTVSGYVVLSNGTTVPCTGARSGNKASILIPPAAYVSGSVFISIFITDGTTVTTLAAVSSSVLLARTDSQVDPGSVVTDWTQTINGAMQSVEDAAENLGHIVATPYAELTYPVPLGKYTYYNDNLYKCVSTISTSEEFTPAHWSSAINLGDEVNSLKDNPVFTGSVSMGRAENSTVGITSTALGYSVTASGENSVAEGSSSSATSEEAHAEGLHTTASGNWSHSEGSYTTASGSGSHAEGKSTIANHLAQHVFGTFNVADTSTASADQKGSYIEIVGNGATVSERSNARTLDWNGNETLSGDLTVGKGTNNETSVIALKSACNKVELINGLAFIADTAIHTSGSEWAGLTGRCCTEFIPCGAGLEVKYAGESNHASINGISFYDIFKKYISGYANNGPNGTEITVTSPTGTAYCRLSTDSNIPCYVKVPNGSLSDAFDRLIDAEPIVATRVIQDDLLNTTNQNLVDSATFTKSGVTISENIYTIDAGGYLFLASKLYGVFSKKANVQFTLVSGSGYTAKYIIPFNPSTGTGTQADFLQRKNTYGETVFYAEFVPSDVTSEKQYVQIRIDNRDGSAPLVIKDLIVTADATYFTMQSSTMYVSTNGSDNTGDGSYSHPFATVNKALFAGADKIMVLAGKYTQTIDMSKTKKSHITIVSNDPTGRAVFVSPGAFVTSSDTESSYSGVYIAEYTATISTGTRLYQDGVPDVNTAISDSERNPYERGQLYRCLDTKIIPCSANNLTDAIAEIQSDSANNIYKYYYDTTNHLLYFSRPQTINASNPIMMSTGYVLFTNHRKRSMQLDVYGIETKYMMFDVRDTAACHIEDCKCAYAYGSGAFLYADCLSAEFVRCEACQAHGNSSGDGFNANGVSTVDRYSRKETARLVDCWSHDCLDDGYSDHYQSETEVWGGLFEYNGKAGITPSYGACCSCYGVLSRHNYSGFLYLGLVPEGLGGHGQMMCVDCIAENNTDSSLGYGFGVKHAGNSAKLVNCKSIGNRIGYYAESDARIEMIDCGISGNASATGGGGTKITNNTTLLVV